MNSNDKEDNEDDEEDINSRLTKEKSLEKNESTDHVQEEKKE